VRVTWLRLLRAIQVLSLVVSLSSPVPLRASTLEGAPLQVLTPRSGRRVEATLRRLGEDWVARDLQVLPEQIQLTVCPTAQPAACVDVHLVRPDPDCPGVGVGPFCATGVALAPALTARLREAFDALDASDVWSAPGGGNQVEGFAGQVPEHTPRERHPDRPRAFEPGEDARPAPASPCSVPLALGMTLVLLLVPWSAGWLGARWVGRRPRSLRPWHRRALVASVLLVLAGSLLAARLAPWDVAWVIGTCAVGALVGGSGRAAALRFGAILVGVGAAFALAEAVVRVVDVAPPDLPPASCARLLRDESLLARVETPPVCRALLPRELPARLAEEGRGLADGARAVLHLGDSMIAAFAVAPEETMSAHLADLMPEVAHFDASFPGTALDYHALVAASWTARRSFERVVVYLYSGNDLSDLGAEGDCCAGRSWADVSEDGDVSLCEPTSPTVWASVRKALWHGPAPYVLRVATGGSLVAGRLVEAWASRGVRSLRTEDGLKRTELLLAWLDHRLAERGVALAVVIVPTRAAWLGREPELERAFREAVTTTAARLSIPVLDLLPVFRAEASRSDPTDPYDTPDGHFGRRGHRQVAVAVARFLRGLGAPAEAP